MPPIIPDPEEQLPPGENPEVQEVLGELDERARAQPQTPSPPAREADGVKHTGQIARDVYRD